MRGQPINICITAASAPNNAAPATIEMTTIPEIALAALRLCSEPAWVGHIFRGLGTRAVDARDLLQEV